MNDGQRTNALLALLSFDRPLEVLLRDLHRISWESETELVVLQGSQIQAVLERYISGDLSSRAVEDWANAIETREDVGFTTSDLKDIIFELANPEICAKIAPGLAENLIARIDGNQES
jgi:hypothetical protein